MCLVGNHDDVVTLGVAFVGIDVLVEFLDQREDVRLVFGEQPAEMVATGRPAGLLVMVHDPAAGERLVDLRIEVITIGQHKKRKVAAQFAMDFAGEHRH